MLDKFVANLLTSYLGKYIANLDKHHVKVSLWHGHVVLRNLILKPNALRYLDLPVSVKEGRIGELSVSIPWTKLQSESIRVEIRNVVVIVHPKKAAAFDAAQEEKDELERKEEALQVFEALRAATLASKQKKNKQGGDDDSVSEGTSSLDAAADALDAAAAATDNTFAARLKATMLNNLLVSVHNVLVQYEDVVTNPANPIALTARIASFHAMSCDADYNPSFASPKAPLFFKLVKLEGFALYVESLESGSPAASSSIDPSSTIQRSASSVPYAGRCCDDIEGRYESSSHTSSSTTTESASTTAPSSSAEDPSCSRVSIVLHPVTFIVKLQHQPVPFQPEIPRWSGVIEIDTTTVHVNRNQWDAVWRSVKYVQRFDQYEAFLKFRPAMSVAEDPRAWWRFAGQSVQHVLRSKRTRTKFNWGAYVEAKTMEREYMLLHKRRQPDTPWLVPLTKLEKQRCEVLEKAMHVDSIKLARSLAYARVALEAEQHTAREQYLASQKTKKQATANSGGTAATGGTGAKSGGWWSWWSGTSASTEPVAETEEDQKEIEKLWGLIDADRWSTQQRLVIAKELGIADSDVAGLSTATATPMPSTAKNGGASSNSSSTSSERAVQCFLRLSSAYIALLDYDGKAFASFSLEDLGAAFHMDSNNNNSGNATSASSWSLRAHVGDFSLNDEQFEQQQYGGRRNDVAASSSARDGRSGGRMAIVRTAKERTSATAARLWLRKERQAVLHGHLRSVRQGGDAAASSSILPSEEDAAWIPAKYRTPEQAAIRISYDRVVMSSSAATPQQQDTKGSTNKKKNIAAPFHNNQYPEFVTGVQLLPMDVRMSVPWMQRVVRFWGVDMTLVDSSSAANSDPHNIAGRRMRAMNVIRGAREQLASLLALIERTPLTFTRIAAKDLCFMIPEDAVSQELRVHCEELTVANDWAKAAERRFRLIDEPRKLYEEKLHEQREKQEETAENEKSSTPASTGGTSQDEEGDEDDALLHNSRVVNAQDADWSDDWTIELVKLSLYTSWSGGYDAALMKATSGSVTMKKLIVAQRLQSPKISLDLLFPGDVCLEGPLEGYEVLFSSMTALTDFLNNASGRGGAANQEQQSSNSQRGGGGPAASARVSLKEEFMCVVEGPTLSFIVADESILAPLQQYAAPPVPKQRRVVEVSRGSLTVFHTSRPSMPHATLELKPNQFHVVRDGVLVTLYVERGGKHHIVREHLFPAREMLADALRLTVADVVASPLPQLWFLIGERFQRPESEMFPRLSPDDKEELIGCYGVLEESSSTVPCHALKFHMDSTRDAERLQRVIARSTASEGLSSKGIPTIAEARNASILLDSDGIELPPQVMTDVMFAVCGVFSLGIRPCLPTDCTNFQFLDRRTRGGRGSAAAGDDELFNSEGNNSGGTATTSGPSTTNGSMSCMMPRFTMNMCVTQFVRTIEVNAESMTVMASDEIRVGAAAAADGSTDMDEEKPVEQQNLGKEIEEKMTMRRVLYAAPKGVAVVHVDKHSDDSGGGDAASPASSSSPSSPGGGRRTSAAGDSESRDSTPYGSPLMTTANKRRQHQQQQSSFLTPQSATTASAEQQQPQQQQPPTLPEVHPNDGFMMTFESSWLPGTTGQIDVTCLGDLQLVLNDDFAAYGELMWDLLGVMMMKQYSATICRALPWETPIELICDPTDKVERMVIDFTTLGNVEVLMEYEAGGLYRGMPRLPKGTQARLTGRHLTLRWRVNELMNDTTLWIDDPKLETFFHRYTVLTTSGGSPYTVFMTPRRAPNGDRDDDGEMPAAAGLNSATASNPTTGITRLIPASTTAVAQMSFSYRVLYQPAGISETAWRSSVGSTTGYQFTHYLTVTILNSLLRYWQQDLWHLIEYFTNGLMHRLGMISWRRPFAIHRPQFLWPLPKDAPGPSFSTALLHKHIELNDCELCLPHDALLAPQLWGFVERMTMWDEVVVEHEAGGTTTTTTTSSATPADPGATAKKVSAASKDFLLSSNGEFSVEGVSFETCEVRTGFKIDFTGLSLWAAKPLPGSHKVVTSFNFDERDVLHRDPEFTDLIVNNMSLRYWMLFDASCMLKQESQKTLGMHFGEMHIHSSSEQLALLFDWVSGVFVKNPWVGKYGPKVFAVPPFPNLAERDGKPWIVYDYNIEVERMMIHLRDPTINYAATPNPDGPTIDRQPINVVLDLKRAIILLRWLSDESFFSQYAMETIDGWDFMRTAWKTQQQQHTSNSVNNGGPGGNRASRSFAPMLSSSEHYHKDIFVKVPREVVSTQQHFLKIVPADATGAASLLVKHGRGGTGVGGAALTQRAEERFGLNIIYGWKKSLFYDHGDGKGEVFDEPKEEKIVYSQSDIGCIEVDVVPKFLFDLKDSLLSLRVRNAIAPLFKWGPIAAFDEPGAPWDPKTQEWRTRHSAQIQVLTIVFFDLSRKKPTPSFFVSLEDISVTAESTFHHASSKLYAQVAKVAQNGICDDELKGRPLLVPQSTTVNAQKFRQYASYRRDPQERLEQQQQRSVNANLEASVASPLSRERRKGSSAFGPALSAAPAPPPQVSSTSVGANDAPPLLWIDQSSDRGLVGEFGCVWVFVPLKEQLGRLKTTLMDEGLRELAWIGAYAEERYARREGIFPAVPPLDAPASATSADSHAGDIHFTIHHPCLVVSEHESMLSQTSPNQQRGVVINLGLMVIGSSFVPNTSSEVGGDEVDLRSSSPSPLIADNVIDIGLPASWMASDSFVQKKSSLESPRRPTPSSQHPGGPTTTTTPATRTYSFFLQEGHMRSLHRDTHQLIKPMNVRVDGTKKDDGVIDVGVRMDGLHIDVALEYYESILRSLVRHLLMDEGEIVDQREQQRGGDSGPSGGGSSGGGGRGAAAGGGGDTASMYSVGGRSSATGFSAAKSAKLRRQSIAATSAIYEPHHDEEDNNGQGGGGDNESGGKRSGGKKSNRRTAPPAATGTAASLALSKMNVHLQWEFVKIRVFSETMAVSFVVGRVVVDYSSQSGPRHLLLGRRKQQLTSLVRGGKDKKSSVELVPAASIQKEFGSVVGVAWSTDGGSKRPEDDDDEDDDGSASDVIPYDEGSSDALLTARQASSSNAGTPRKNRRSRDTSATILADSDTGGGGGVQRQLSSSTAGAGGSERPTTDQQDSGALLRSTAASNLDSPRRRRKRSAPAVAPSTIYRKRPAAPTVAITTIALSLQFLRLGVDGRQPLVAMESATSTATTGGDGLSKTAAAEADSDAPPVQFTMTSMDQDWKMNGDLGVTRIVLEHHSLVSAISFLYEPYRRIVLPKYTAFEIKEIFEDITLSQRLLLSARTVLRVSSRDKNFITLNANGHPIHFLDSGGRSLILLESGLTLRIINATVYLYGKTLDHYITAGNGSYVVVDPLLCNIVAGSVATDENEAANAAAASGDDDRDLEDDDNGTDDDNGVVELQPSLGTVKSFVQGDLKHVASNRVVWVPRNVSQQMAVRAAFFLLVPEHQGAATTTTAAGSGTAAAPAPPRVASTMLHGRQPQAKPQAQTDDLSQRALMLAANVSVAWSLQLFSGELTEHGVFEITDLEAECQYLTGATKTDYSSLISPWEVKVDVAGRRKFLKDEHVRNITLTSPIGVDLRFRYGDIQLSLAAVGHAKAALGHIESNVIVAATSASVEPQNEFAALEEEQDDEANRRLENGDIDASRGGRGGDNNKRKKEHNPLTTPGKMEMIVTTSIPRVGVYLVDDSSSMDFPLFYVSVTNIHTPVCHQAPFLLKLHLTFGFQVEYYNFHDSAWDRLVEPVMLNIAMRDLQNRSLQDVQARRGVQKAGVQIKSLRVRFTPMAAEAVSKTLKLLDRLSEQSTPAAVAASSDDGSPLGTTTSASSAAASATTSPPVVASSAVSSQEFFAYEVTQQLGPDIKIGFADDDKGRFPKPKLLRMMELYAFNFPRIEGRELPASQHYITITTETSEQLLRISRVGLQILPLQFGGIRQDCVADIQVREGKKRVTLRSNISFENQLPFPIVLGGIGSVFVNGSQTVSTDAMRRRCVMVPQLPFRCHEVSMGVTYDALSNHYNQTFLCTAEIDDPEIQRQHQREAERLMRVANGTVSASASVTSGVSLQRAVYFLLRFAPKLKISDESHLYDCKGIFEAPFSIVNNTGLPITITLLSKQPHPRAKQGLLDFSEKFSFMHIDALSIPAQSRRAITQVDPLRDVFMDVTFQQNNGASIARMGAKRQSTPALIRSDKKASRDTHIILHDPKGESIMLHIDYADREVILYCAFWLVNQTTHVLQVMDSNPKRRGNMLAGMASEGLPPSGTPFAFGSEKMERLGDKAHLYIRVGRKTNSGSSSPTAAAAAAAGDQKSLSTAASAADLMWSQWSDAILIMPVGEWSVFQCGETEPITLSYSIQFVGGSLKDTRVICVTPRWIVVNRTPFALGLRQENVKHADETENGPLASMESRVMDFAAVKGTNHMQLKLAQVPGEIDRGSWTQAFPIEVFGDQYLNIRYEHVVRASDNPNVVVAVRRESIVACVSVYRRGSTLYIVLEKASVPPYTIENRSQYPVFVAQSGKASSSSKLTVYPHVTKGFVWDDPTAHPLIMVLTAATSISGKGSSRPIDINLEASLLVKRTKYQLQQELLLPGGVTLYVRVRAMAGSFAISICEDNLIDRMRSLPFFQYSYQFHLESFYALVSSAEEDLMLLTIRPVKLSVTQQCPSEGEDDEQHIEVSTSVIQLDDERSTAKERVVLQLIDGRSTYLKLQRKMQRLTPILHVTKLEYVMQPVEIHMEDSFLFAVLKLVEQLQETFSGGKVATASAGGGGGAANSSATTGGGNAVIVGSAGSDTPLTTTKQASAVGFTNNNKRNSASAASLLQDDPTSPTIKQLYPAAPWAPEIEAAKAAVASEETFQNKVAFIERLLIEQIVVSLSLYRAHDANNDPIREKLGFLSVLIRSVQDARVDWRRVEQSNIYDKIWLLATLYSNFYAHTLQAQMLNVLHVAGLDVMRGFVTDLLQSYFSSTATTHIDRSRPRIPRRKEAHLLIDTERDVVISSADSAATLASGDEGSGAWDKMDDASQYRWVKFTGSSGGGGGGASSKKMKGGSVQSLAYQQPWNAFVSQVTNRELHTHGHHALCNAVRTRSFITGAPASSCRRCAMIDQMRDERIESGSMSVLPHPDSKLVTWEEFTHHVSWEEFVAICTPDQVRQYAEMVRDAILGSPRNVIRIDASLLWCLKE